MSVPDPPIPNAQGHAARTISVRPSVWRPRASGTRVGMIQLGKEFAKAGFDNVHLHQVGPDQDGFLGFFERELSLASHN